MKRHLLLFLIVLLACPAVGMAYIGQAYSSQIGYMGTSSIGYMRIGYGWMGSPVCMPAPTPPICGIRPPVCRPPVVRPPVCRPPVVRPPVCRPPVRPPVCPPVACPPVRPPVVCPPPSTGGNNVNTNINIVSPTFTQNTYVNGRSY